MGKLIFRLFLFIVFISLTGGGYLFYKGTLTPSFFESESPSLEIVKEIKGVGGDPTPISLLVTDSGSGLDEVIVRGEQAGRRFDIFKKTYSGERIFEDKVEVIINPKESAIREGSIKLFISAFDKSFFSNKKEISIEIPVNFKKPRVEVVTPQHNVNMGGAELVFYKATGAEIQTSGVKARNWIFKGYPASKISSEFSHFPDLYFAFFGVPFDWNPDTERLTVFATDAIGNSATSSFNYLVLRKRFPTPEMKLTEDFLNAKLPELLSQTEENPALGDSLEAKVKQFRSINESFRGKLGAKLVEIMNDSSPQKLWKQPLIRPLAGAPRSIFGERRKYLVGSIDAGSSVHEGIDLAATANAPVFAASDGIVKFADVLGIYGNSVVLDHGLGVFTLYGHLSSISCAVGDRVGSGQPIGRTGTTGLAGGDHLHFEVRVHGLPVTPIEWWDSNWLLDHFDRKIESVQDQMLSLAALEADIEKPVE